MKDSRPPRTVLPGLDSMSPLVDRSKFVSKWAASRASRKH